MKKFILGFILMISVGALIAQNSGDLGSRDAKVLHNQGLEFLNQKDLRKAQIYFKTAILVDPNFYESYLELAYLHVIQQQYKTAEFYGGKAAKLKPEEATAHLILAQALIGQKRYDQAEFSITTAAKIDPLRVSRLGAKFVSNQGSLALAMFYFRVVRKVDPANGLNNLNLSYALQISEKYAESEELLVEIINNPRTEQPYFDKAYSLYFNRLIAEKEYSKVLAMASKQSHRGTRDQYLYLALSHFMIGNMSEFKDNSRLYFQNLQKTPPNSLVDWANSQLKNIEEGTSASS